MTLPALWIRQNMLQSPGPANNNNERRLTEAEMKVQRSLKKLSIPEWYLNNSSHPPKILMNDTPIESRPPSWKGQSTKKTAVCSTPIMPVNNSTVSRDGVLETEIGPPTLPYQSYGTFRINRNSPEKSPTSKKGVWPQKNQSREKKSSKSRLMNISRTFPRVSPSRKIQNINLVFSQPPKSHSHTITDLDASDPTIDMSADSLETQISKPTIETPASMMITDLDASETEMNMIQDSLAIPSTKSNRRLQTPPISLDSWKVTDIDDPESEMIEKNNPSSNTNQDTDFMDQTLETSKLADASVNSTCSETRASKMTNQQLTYIKPWKRVAKPEIRSCVTPEGKFATGTSFKLRASSTPQGSPVSLFSASAIDNTSRTICKEQPTSGLSILSSKNTKKSPPTSPRVMKPKISEEEEICEACKADPSRARSSPTSRPSSGFRPKNLLPPIGEKPSNSEQSTSPTPSEVFLTSKKKSSELENIIKRKQQPGKSLVQEIIEELNEKCRTSAQPTYVSPGSKNFVKKLVKALEKGKTCVGRKQPEDVSYYRYANYEDYEDKENPEEDVFVESENGSEDESKSAAVSTTLSYKDTDSSSNGSDYDLHSPTMKLDYKYDWNMNMEKNRNETTTMKSMATSTPETDEKDNDSVYWIPIAKTKLPRTSSLNCMMSRLSTSNPTEPSPCISPIKQMNDVKSYTWGRTYKTNERTRILRRIDEITVLDSGYEDRSRIHSSESSDDNTWFDDSDSTWTASETGSNVSFSLGSALRRERRYAGQIHGRPFII